MSTHDEIDDLRDELERTEQDADNLTRFNSELTEELDTLRGANSALVDELEALRLRPMVGSVGKVSRELEEERKLRQAAQAQVGRVLAFAEQIETLPGLGGRPSSTATIMADALRKVVAGEQP